SEQNQLQTYYDRFLLRPDLKGGVQAGDFDLLSKVFNYAVRTSRTPVFSGNKAASSNEQTLSQEILSRKQVSAVFGLLTSIGKTQSLQTLPNPNTPNPLEWSRATALFIEMLSSGIVPSNDNLLLMLDQLDQAGEQVAEAIFLMSDPKVIRDLWKQCEDLLKDIIQGLPDVFLASALYTSCLDKPILIQGYACPQIECVAKPAPTFFPYPNPPSKAFMVNGVASFETPGYLWKENLPPNVKDAGGYFFRINDGKNNFNPVKTAVELGLIEIVRVNEIEGVSLNLGKFPSTGSSGNFISTDTVQTVEMRFLKEPLNGFRIPGKRHKVLIQDSAKPGDPGRIYEWDEWDWRESIASLQNLYAAQKLPFEPKVFPDIFDDKGNYKASPDNCLTFADFLTYQLNNHLEYRKAEFVSNSSQLVREKNKEKYDRFTVLSSYLNVCLNIHRQGQSHQANDAVLDIVAPTVEGAEKVEDKFQLLLKQNRKENIETTPVPNCPLLKRTVNNVLGTQSMEEFIKAKNLELSGSSNLGNQLNLQQDMIRRWSFIEDVRQQVMSWILAYDLPATRFYGMKPSELFRPFQVDEMQTLLLHHLPSSSECTILPPFPLFQYAPEEGEKKLKEHLAVYVRELKKDNQQALVLIQLGANHYAALLLQRKLGKIDANYFDVTEKSIPLSVAKVLTSLGTQPIKLADDTPLIEYNNPFASSMLIATLEKYIKDGKSSLPVNALLSLRKSKDLHLLSQRAIARKSPASTSFNPLRYNLGGLINLKYFHSSTATSLSNRAFWAGSLGFFGAVFGGLIGELFKKPEIGVGTGLLGLGLGSLVPGGQKEKDYATYKNDATTQFQVNNPLALEYANAALDIKEENPSDGTISNTRKEQLVMLYRLGYYDTFYKQLSDSLAKQADLKAALEDLAQYFEENDCWVPAFNCFRSILLIDPSNENIIYKHANYLFNFGRYAEIIDFINTNQGFVKDPVLAVTINELKINAEIKLKKSKA
ncbi:MAG TPA: hypothetical protein VMR37_00865, partial [Rhabdochlamydiaceae bacterium]|nr:hypothetical protein [Rhabdochlamydiaceae bacterium]